ncbi:MAG: 50S ribosomal protein L22 [Parcubacteria group bacterium]|nr:50S ribosomal protein L22 [Parcubacteria group bacterium]
MKAFLKNYRQSPRKVRLLADLIRTKDVKTARMLLAAAPKRAALPVQKLLDSAVSNLQTKDAEENFFVKEVRVDAGPTLKRMMPRARGSAYLIRKRTSRITITLEEKNQDQKVKTIKTSKNLKPTT